MANYSFKTDMDFEDGTTINNSNFSQANPNTVFPNLVGKNITFDNCNLVNVNIDENWTVEGCNIAQISRCTHLHPEYVDKGVAECAENCSHIIDTDTVDIDGETIIIYHYKDTVV